MCNYRTGVNSFLSYASGFSLPLVVCESIRAYEKNWVWPRSEYDTFLLFQAGAMPICS